MRFRADQPRRTRRSRPAPALDVVGRERRPHAARARSATPASSRLEQVGGDLVLPVERGAEHRRVVGVDRDRRRRRRGTPGSGARRGSSTARVAMLDDGHTSSGMPRSARWASSAGSWAAEVPCPIRSAPSRSQRVPDRLRAGGLAGVRHAVQPGGPGGVEVRLELRPRHPDLGPAQPEADQGVRAVVEGVAQGRVGRGQARLPRDVVDPAQHQPEVALDRDPGVLDRLGVGLDRHPAVVGVRAHRGVRRAGELGVPQPLAGGHLAADLVGEVADVLGGADQVDDREVDLDEVREVAELEEPAQLVGVARHRARVPLGELGDDPRRGGADVVHVQLGLGQPGDEVGQRRGRRRLSLLQLGDQVVGDLVHGPAVLEDLAVEQDRRGAAARRRRWRPWSRWSPSPRPRWPRCRRGRRTPSAPASTARSTSSSSSGNGPRLVRLVLEEQVVELLGDLGAGLVQHDREGAGGPGGVVAAPWLSRLNGRYSTCTLPSLASWARSSRVARLELAAVGAEEVLVDDDRVGGVGRADGQAELAAGGRRG